MNTYSLTDQGKERSNNQDYLANYFQARFDLLIIADGMGGHQAGEIASQLAIETMRNFFIEEKNREDYKNLLDEGIQLANQAVKEHASGHSECQGMGTTIVAALIYEDQLLVAHVGDSRAYLWREGELKALTRDHSLVADLIAEGLLTEEAAKTHPDRSAVTRALGLFDQVQVDIASFDLIDEDKILLCSDGLTSMVSDQEIAETISKLANTRVEAETLVDLANERGGRDNITVTLYEYRS